VERSLLRPARRRVIDQAHPRLIDQRRTRVGARAHRRMVDQAHPRVMRQAHPRRSWRRLVRGHDLTNMALVAVLLTGSLAATSVGAVLASGSTGPISVASFRPASPADVVPTRSVSPLSRSRMTDAADRLVPARTTCPPAGSQASVGSSSASDQATGVAPSAAGAVLGAPVGRPVAAFLGDSYTTGYNGDGLGDEGWPAKISRALGLQPLVRAVAGTGFVNPGWTGQPIRTQLDAVIQANPRVVFLAGGHNDRSYGATAAIRAAIPVIDRLRTALPGAILVVIGPIWQDGSPPTSLRSLADQLRRKAGSVGAIFIDPIRAGWFAGTWQRLISPDGIHPTTAGYDRIAGLVLAALRSNTTFEARLTGIRPAAAARPAPSRPAPSRPAPTASPAPAASPGSAVQQALCSS
jgi:lysophospholipase L1-like esterase